MIYQTHIHMTIYDLEKQKCSSGNKIIELHFPPYDGLILQERTGPTGPIRGTTWDIEEECFYCSIEMQESRPSDGDNLDFDFLVECAVGDGYEGFNTILHLK